jgi:hypothetical protein
MSNLADHFADLSQHELAAARAAISMSDRSAHLESAFRFAQMAVQETQARGNVVPFGRMVAEGIARSQSLNLPPS